ncbi:MAG: autoinducer 2 ABC transporter substrate-binding protein [Termitinemataceae bacterium]|nr:MAG: autoinducer 2 ABC transporter substrate-binding protein [Termitinemataceae bacterium]
MNIICKKIMPALLALTAAGVVFVGCSKKSGTASAISMYAIPKQKIPWFEPYSQGIERAAKEFGFNGYYLPPSTADEAEQVRLTRDAINQGANALLVVPNDANSLVPVFSEAKKKGIAVLTHESPDQPEADYNVEMINSDVYGEHFAEELAKQIGGEGEYVIFVGSLTVPAHNIWADSAEKYMAKNYPGITLAASRFPVAEDREKSRQTALDILKTYPNLKGFITIGSQGGPGAGQALRELGLTDKVAVVGGGTPDEARPFVKDGAWDVVILWNSGDASYAMAYIAKLILDGKKDEVKPGFTIPGLGSPQIKGINILFDNPLILTRDNIDDYHF